MNIFKDIIASYGVSVTIRKEMGDAIQAACGQLKAAHGRKRRFMNNIVGLVKIGFS